MNDLISQGRAYVRLIEAAGLLLDGELDDAERVLLEQVRRVYTAKLRALVVAQPPAVTAQVLAASERINAPAQEFLKN